MLPRLRIFLLLLIIFVLLAAGASCSLIEPSKGRAAVESTVIGVVNTYLTAVAAGDERRLNGIVYWDLFLGRNGGELLTRSEIHTQIEQIKTRWTPDKNPLLGLEVINVSVSGDDAKVTVRKAGKPDFPTIWVKVVWSGSGWLVAQDSLFGRDKLFAEYLSGEKQ